MKRIKGYSHLLLCNWGWVVLLFALVLGCFSIYWGSFVDEGDNFTLGWLIANGKVLYRDVFSHHFPFPYYYAAAVTKVFGPSIFFLRFSVWAFLVLAFAVSMRLTGYHKSLGLAALIWSIIRHFYRGNMFLYNPFCAAGMVVIFVLTLAVLLDHRRPGWKYFAVFGLFGGIAVLSDPLSVYALGVAILLILIKNYRSGILALAWTGACLAVCGIYLFASGSAYAFFQDAFLFNSQVYSKYLGASSLRFKDIWLSFVQGLGLLNPAWQNLDPLKPLAYSSKEIDRWLYTGFVYRLGFILAALYLIFQKKYYSGAFVYLFATALLAISAGDFRGQPFVLVAWVTIAGLITREWWPKSLARPLRYIQLVTAGLLGLTAFWVSSRSITYLGKNWQNSLPQADFSSLVEDARQLRSLTCGQADVYLVSYPGGTYSYWFSNLPPASRYIIMWPWVADVGLSQSIEEIQSHPLVIVVRPNSMVWDLYDTKIYLRPLDQVLEEHYVQVKPDTFISAELARKCGLLSQGK